MVFSFLFFSDHGSALLYPCFSHLNAGLMMGVLLVCPWVSCVLIEFSLSFSNDGSALLYPCFSHLNAGLMMGVLLVFPWVSCVLIEFSLSFWFVLFVCVFLLDTSQMRSCFRVCSTFTKAGCCIMCSLFFSFYTHHLTIVGWWESFLSMSYILTPVRWWTFLSFFFWWWVCFAVPLFLTS
jgi:hypothetical protein